MMMPSTLNLGFSYSINKTKNKEGALMSVEVIMMRRMTQIKLTPENCKGLSSLLLANLELKEQNYFSESASLFRNEHVVKMR